MKLSLGKLPWYSQLGVFVTLSLGAVAVFYNWYASPLQATIDERAARLASIRTDIDRGLATARRLPEFRREIVALQAQLERLRTVLPEEQDVADLLRRVQAMATQSNLTIRGFTPQAVARREMHMEWPIGLQLEGTYHDFGDFLERISKFPRIINVGNLQIHAHEAPTGGVTVNAEATATTFVLIDEPQPAPATTAARSGGSGH